MQFPQLSDRGPYECMASTNPPLIRKITLDVVGGWKTLAAAATFDLAERTIPRLSSESGPFRAQPSVKRCLLTKCHRRTNSIRANILTLQYSSKGERDAVVAIVEGNGEKSNFLSASAELALCMVGLRPVLGLGQN